MKQCTQCGKVKPLSDYQNVWSKGTKTDRRMSECTQCKVTRDTLRSRERPLGRMVSTAKYRAKKAGIPFDITKDDLVIPRVCPILGCEITAVGGTRLPTSPSLDRIDPSKGYVKGNVWVISDKANRMKQDLTVDLLKKMLLAIETQLESGG